MKKNNYEALIRQNIIKVLSSLLICLITIILIILCNQIPRINIDLTDSKYRNIDIIDISLHNPNSILSFFVLRDISKAEYFVTMPDGKGEKDYFFQNQYDGVEFYGDESFSNQSSASFILLNNDKKHITFFTKMLRSESLQSLRTFILSEIFIFFLAFLGLRLYNLYQCIYRKKYGHSWLIDTHGHLKIAMVYLVLALINLLLIVIICKSPVIEINSSHYFRDIKYSYFLPYDISKTYYRFNIDHNSLSKNDTITWESSEFVEFSNIFPKPDLETAKNIRFIIDQNNNKSFEADFYTINYVSKNIQEIRLFILTTLFLILLSRIVIHLKRCFDDYIPYISHKYGKKKTNKKYSEIRKKK